MPRRLALALALLPAPVLAGGCATDEDPALATSAADLTMGNGVRLNGVRLNGVRLNGTALDGQDLRMIAVALTRAPLAGVPLTDATIDATTGVAGLRATAAGASLTGADLIGSSWTAKLSDGSLLTLDIDGATAVGPLWTYQVSYATTTGREPLCDAVGGAPQAAIAVPGQWDERSGVEGGGSYAALDGRFTFACRGAAIAKCLELGYTPWAGHADHMVACTRLLRDDICGDGSAHTVDGTPVNLYDSLGLQVDDQTWNIEAEWTPAGARCLTRRANSRVTLGGPHLDCTPHTSRTCGTFANGALLISELGGL